MVEKTWGDFYEGITGNKDLLEGNILEHQPFIATIARFLRSGDKVLEIGSGTGVIGWPLAQGGVKVISIDNDPEILKQAQINAAVLGADIEFQEADAFHLPFGNREFKVSFSLGLLEHFSDDDIARLVFSHQRVADVVVVGIPIKGNKSPAFGNERYLTMEEWEALLKPMGATEGYIYGHEPCACFTFQRKPQGVRSPTLSGLVVTKDSEERIGRLLRSMRLFCDELVVVVDSKSTDRTLAICKGLADMVVQWECPGGIVEPIIEKAHELCSGDWVIKLDDDELISEGILELKEMLELQPWYVGCLALPRYDLYEDEMHYIKSADWYPGTQPRVFRKGAFDQKDIYCHVPPQVRNGVPQIVSHPHIFHYRNLLRSRAEREKAWQRNESDSSLLDNEWYKHFYLFEDYDFEVGEVEEKPLLANEDKEAV